MSTPAALAVAHGVTTAQDISIGHVLLQMVVALAIVVGGIWGFGKIMHRTGRGTGTRRNGTRGNGTRARHPRAPAHGLTVLSRQMVGKGKSIAVVQAGGQCFLVGIADSGLTPLGELKPVPGADDDDATPPETVDRRAMARPTVGGQAMALAPLDLGSIDLAAFTAGDGTDADSGRAVLQPAAGTIPSPGRANRRWGRADSPPPPTMRAWLDGLREATVRR